MINLGLGRFQRYETNGIQPEPVKVLKTAKYADFAAEQYTPIALKISQVAKSWEKGYRGKTLSGVPVPIFIIDTGGACGHHDLIAAWGRYPRARGRTHKRGSNPRYIVTGGLDCTQRDWEKPCGFGHRWYSKHWYDNDGHGTHVAGTAGARDNGFGVVGVAPEADLWALRVFVETPNGLYTCDAWIAKAIRHAIQFARKFYNQPSGLQGGVLNLSLGTRGHMQSCVRQALQEAVKAGFVCVAAAGNDGKGVNEPASYPECIAVGAMSREKTRKKWSSHGKQVDVAGVGSGVWSCYPPNGYCQLDGTSMAAPSIAGFAALWKGKYAELGAAANTYRFRNKLVYATIPIDGDMLADELGWRYVNSPSLASWLDLHDPRPGRRSLPIPGRDIEIIVG